MFEMEFRGNDTLLLAGRFDAAQVEKAASIFDCIERSCAVDFEKLEYISSAGLSVLLATQKRLRSTGNQLRLRNMNKHVREVFQYAGFDVIFEIE